MKLNSFFKILNRKINKYDKIATNPFTDSRRVIIVWVEEPDEMNTSTYSYEYKKKKTD